MIVINIKDNRWIFVLWHNVRKLTSSEIIDHAPTHLIIRKKITKYNHVVTHKTYFVTKLQENSWNTASSNLNKIIFHYVPRSSQISQQQQEHPTVTSIYWILIEILFFSQRPAGYCIPLELSDIGWCAKNPSARRHQISSTVIYIRK